ncbi:MAG: hypothetical protein BEN19_03915 [Epulopiscium sp. Nuni2H_MBin003]|nr:MAG: hypothetical protein BEN19_03915 [Epulopiscium sp. Nuni2H_MBin003]
MNNKSLIKLSIFLATILVACMVRLIYISQSSTLSVHYANVRLAKLEDQVQRGNFYDTSGLALTQNIEDTRHYLYDGRYAHSVGYVQFGEYGLEKELSKHLLSPTYNLVEIAKSLFTGSQFTGRDVFLNIDDTLQQVCEQVLADSKGAIILIESDTGKIRCMYSSPSFNPNMQLDDWQNLLSDTANAPLVNRVTQGVYPPGSTFKIISSIALMNKMPDEFSQLEYNCTGEILVDNQYTISCYNNVSHGKVNLESAFKHSCNTYFVNLANYISYEELANTAEQLLFNQALPTSTLVATSIFNRSDEDVFSNALSYIGQGKTLVTPFHLAMLSSAIANDGILMQPYLTASIEGSRIKNLPVYYGELMTEEMAMTVANMMRETVKTGTGAALNSLDGDIGIKTGTAENETDKAHSWVTGFMKQDASSLAFTILLENQEGMAIEATKQILQAYLENNRNY